MGSSRLPGKVLMPVLGRPLLSYLLERVSPATKLQKIIVATSTEAADTIVAETAASAGATVFRGSEEDVLGRYYGAAKESALDFVVRVTADCPLLDCDMLDWFIGEFEARSDLDYLQTGPTFPEGYDMEIFRFAALEQAWREARKGLEREHVTPYIRENPDLFKVGQLACPYGDLSWVRVTVDEPEDFEVVKAIIEDIYPVDPHFRLANVLDYLRDKRPDLVEKNRHIQRNEGYLRSLAEEERLDGEN